MGLHALIEEAYANDGKIDLEEAWEIICAVKKEAGLPPRGEIFKDVGECIAHKHYGGELHSGCTKGYDILTDKRIQVKARTIKQWGKNAPQLTTAIKVSHFNFDILVAVLFTPEDGSFYEMLEWDMEYIEKHAKLDKHDNIYVMTMTIAHYKAARKVNER